MELTRHGLQDCRHFLHPTYNLASPLGANGIFRSFLLQVATRPHGSCVSRWWRRPCLGDNYRFHSDESSSGVDDCSIWEWRRQTGIPYACATTRDDSRAPWPHCVWMVCGEANSLDCTVAGNSNLLLWHPDWIHLDTDLHR